MDLIILAIVIIILVAAGVYLLRKRRTGQLRDRFGPEYHHAVQKTGDPRKAEAELLEREKRVQKFTLKPLVPGDRERFTARWQRVQAEFVDDPKGSITHADGLLGDVMAARGYPVSDFEQRSADLSVDHPVVVQNYRAARDIAQRHERGDASTEDLRQAMIHYRALFEELTEDGNDSKRTESSNKPVTEDTRKETSRDRG